MEDNFEIQILIRIKSFQTQSPRGVWPKNKKGKVDSNFSFQWTHLGSNQGPTDYESVALTN